MESIINEIKAAEERAEATVAAAKEEARAIAERAAAEAELTVAQAKDAAKAARAGVLARAETEAERAYAETLGRGVERASRRARDASGKLDAAADRIVEAVLHGNR